MSCRHDSSSLASKQRRHFNKLLARATVCASSAFICTALLPTVNANASNVVIPAQQASTVDDQFGVSSQSLFVSPGQSISTQVSVSNSLIAEHHESGGLSLALLVYPRVRNSRDYDNAVKDEMRGSALSLNDAPLEQLAPLSTSQDSATYSIDLPNSDLSDGIYPIRIELRDNDNETIERRNSFVISAGTRNKINTSVVLPLTQTSAPASLQNSISSIELENFASIAETLRTYPNTPFDIATNGQTINAISKQQPALVSQIANSTNAAIHWTSYTTYSPSLFQTPATNNEIQQQLVASRDSITSNFTTNVSQRPVLGASGSSQTVANIPEIKAIEPVIDSIWVDSGGDSLTPLMSSTADFDENTSKEQNIILSESRFAEALVNDVDPAVQVAQAISALSLQNLTKSENQLQNTIDDKNNFARTMIGVAPTKTSAQTIKLLVAQLSNSPLHQLRWLDENVAPLITNAEGLDEVKINSADDIIDTLPPSDEELRTLANTRATYESFVRLVGAETALTAQLGDALLRTADSRFGTDERIAFLKLIDQAVIDEFGQVRVPSDRPVRLTARHGDIPVTVESNVNYPIKVLIRVDSRQLTFPNGNEQLITLEKKNTTSRISVTARGSGTFPLEVTVLTPDGAIELGRTTITVRSTAFSGVGVAISVLAIAVLSFWWGRELIKARRRRILATTSIEATESTSPTTNTVDPQIEVDRDLNLP